MIMHLMWQSPAITTFLQRHAKITSAPLPATTKHLKGIDHDLPLLRKNSAAHETRTVLN